MNLISIQSHVAYGHVGNSVAVFALQRLGCEVWPVHTVQFSNHTGYGSSKGEVFGAALISQIVSGIAERGVLGGCDGVLSGYLGSVETGEAILDAVARVRAANPRASYCCDPVIGDRGREFVRPGIADFLRDRAVPAARIVTPNHFELERLVGHPAASRAEILSAAHALHERGPEVVLVTSVQSEETPPDQIDTIASIAGDAFLVRTPRLPVAANGAGDLIAALFFYHYLRAGSAAEALSRATSSTFGVLRRTLDAGSPELLLIAAQQEIIAPTQTFEPVGIFPPGHARSGS